MSQLFSKLIVGAEKGEKLLDFFLYDKRSHLSAAPLDITFERTYTIHVTRKLFGHTNSAATLVSLTPTGSSLWRGSCLFFIGAVDWNYIEIF